MTVAGGRLDNFWVAASNLVGLSFQVYRYMDLRNEQYLAVIYKCNEFYQGFIEELDIIQVSNLCFFDLPGSLDEIFNAGKPVVRKKPVPFIRNRPGTFSYSSQNANPAWCVPCFLLVFWDRRMLYCRHLNLQDAGF